MQDSMKPFSEYFKKTIFTVKESGCSIFVCENFLHRWLCFDDSFVQTIINKHILSRPVLAYLPTLCINLFCEQTKHDAVMLGTGGGAIAHYTRKYYPNTSLTLVEHSDAIINIAKQFFYIKEPVIQEDASIYVDAMLPCPHLFIDIFINNLLPLHIKQEKFLNNCLAKTSFCASFNLLSQKIEEMNQTIEKIRQIFNNQTLCLFVKGKSNVILHAYTQRNYLETIHLLTKLGKIHPPQLHPNYGLISMIK